MRIHPSRVIRALLSATVVLFIIFNVHLFVYQHTHPMDGADTLQGGQRATFSQEIRSVVKAQNALTGDKLSNQRTNVSDIANIKGMVTNKANKKIEHTWEDIDESNKTAIKLAMDRVNQEELVYNLDKFKLQFTPNSVVIVVQVHDRIQYLKFLLRSLSEAYDIHKALLIISHDFLSNELNRVVQSIDFCPVVQIYYPYSMQVFPDVFPGKDPKDCPRDIKKEKAREIKCNNADHPDKYGHYREAKYAQTKHHWFWKINYVFDELSLTKGFDGLVLLLEEDHYVAPDFLHSLSHMKNIRDESQKSVGILTLGTYDKKPTYGPQSRQVDITEWISSKHNMGMAMDRNWWEIIRKCAQVFCKFDDYNWDWSLQYVSSTCIAGGLKVMLMKGPRVFHIGECGVHHKGKNCDPHAKVQQISSMLAANRQHLFPDKLQVSHVINKKSKSPKGNGGWGDIRDHELCLSFLEHQKPTKTTR
ncbi:alpha-1,6-mannosyl-glycoprotein 2-beta-N-acetylglucosaminyltransferase isoform X2 [Lingula anatina]|uniref:Alpha-1,6-mannosyl-glycoprotein 2-beta-N-acetylglucosaminyltransferase n=1 Tax=Lingula anatina TaxID=7574 RepID=A0A1S3IY54_LINAN|nr:alpha-1,6-mannosyl-glycoprotein 2-beta-N-acetylglucosaminyltransferase isoform X2 [Lingula anatina]|eukprot:XP_013403125.1 alpha-1,6-mannosyl-glycoprotein 2-beta-N-acetylglucosaminyltransferase isoform X2 [Lingula anatina]